MVRLVTSVVVLAVAGCGFPGIPTLVTKSNFEEFEMTRSPGGLGFCIDPGMVLSAVIQRNGSGARIVTMQIIGNDIETPYDCHDGVILGGRCLQVIEVTPRDLTQDELSELDTAFRWMIVRVGALPILFGDPCISTTYRWDKFEAHACSCGNSLSPQDQLQIENVLLSLAEN